MELTPDSAWQWRPKATLTAADACDRCTVFALQYSDCSVLRVRWKSSQTDNLEPETDSELPERDVELHGHAERVSCVKIFPKDAFVLRICSASRDCVMVWSLTGRSRTTQSILVDNLPAEPGWLTFDDTGTLVAIASDRDIKIFVIERKEVLVTLEGHIARVTKGEFHPIHQHLLITASEDRTFKIWDLAARKLWFQSAVLSAYSILSIAINPINGDAAFGFADGSVKVFTIQDGFAKEFAALNVEKFVRKWSQKKQVEDEEGHRESGPLISALPSWARSGGANSISSNNATKTGSHGRIDGESDCTENGASPEVSCPVLSMSYMCANKSEFSSSRSNSTSAAQELNFNGHRDRELLSLAQFIAIGVPGYLLSVNAYSFEVAVVHDFQHYLFAGDGTVDPIYMAKDMCFYRLPGSNVLYCGIMSAFQLCFTMFSVTTGPRTHTTSSSGNQAEVNATSDSLLSFNEKVNLSNEGVSVIPRGPPAKGSVLNLPPLSAKKSSPPKSGKNLDKPITFHSRVKSSGYGSSVGTKRTPPKPRMASRKPTVGPRSKTMSLPSTSVDTFLKEYPTKCGLLQHFQPKHSLPPKTLHQGAILHVEYSSDAKWLATSGTDRVAQVCKLPFSRFGGEGNVFVGHDQAVRTIHWSQNDRMLVSVASDKTSRLWLSDSETSSLTIHGVAPPSSVAAAAGALGSISNIKKSIKQEVVESRFFYMDKFLLSACGNVVRLHQFELDEAFARASSTKTKPRRKNDVKVLENQSLKKRVAQWSFDDVQNVTSFTCVNGAFLSSVAVVAGSDRSLHVLDVGAGGGGRIVRVMRDAHSRAAHTVALPRPTCFASHPSNFYDLLLSSAPDNTTHLWDIRADNCVMRFCEHANRVHPLGVAFSPCMRYVATGSEDRAAYIYDIRTGRKLVKLKGHTDVVTSVDFSPLHPQLATASYDGTVRFYSSNTPD